MEEKRKCFVIMPFSKTTDKHTAEYWDTHYNEFLKPKIEAFPLIAYRSSPLRGDIIRQIITDLVTAPIVIADLTDANPNVYWELGVRQSFKHGTVTIAEYGTTLPFDIGAKGTLYYYPSNHIKMSQFTKQFNDAIRDCLDNPVFPDSHVLEAIGGRGTLFQTLLRDESVRRLKALVAEIKYNLSVLGAIFTVYNKNIAIRKKSEKGMPTVITVRMRFTALELLTCNRYLDAEESFYTAAEEILDNVNLTNDQLSACDISVPERETTEKYLLEREKIYRTRMEAFKSMVEQRIDQLMKTF